MKHLFITARSIDSYLKKEMREIRDRDRKEALKLNLTPRMQRSQRTLQTAIPQRRPRGISCINRISLMQPKEPLLNPSD